MAQQMPPKTKLIEYGPYGSQEQPTFKFILENTDKIKTVNIRSGYIVDGIGFETVDKCNCIKTTWFGGSKGDCNKIQLKYNEHIIQISGFEGEYAWDGNRRCVAQIKIHTNLFPSGYGPYGKMLDCKDIKSFTAPNPTNGPIAGIFGASENYLNSIGVYAKEAQLIVPHGPYGSKAPKNFNVVFDKTDKVTTVTIGSGYVVDGIGFNIVHESGDIKSIYHGGRGHESATINLTQNERITQISGFEGDYMDVGGRRHIAQIKIHTNLAPDGYGPYGRLLNCKNVKSFSSPGPSAGAIAGVFGKTGPYMESLGVYTRKE